jgi:uncharacterized protein YwlG (UPF0340 family)
MQLHLYNRTHRRSFKYIQGRELAASLSALPSLKTGHAEQVVAYCQMLSPVYQAVWHERCRQSIRKTNFHMHGKRRSFMSRLVNDIKTRFGPHVTIAFGAAGPFSRLRG